MLLYPSQFHPYFASQRKYLTLGGNQQRLHISRVQMLTSCVQVPVACPQTNQYTFNTPLTTRIAFTGPGMYSRVSFASEQSIGEVSDMCAVVTCHRMSPMVVVGRSMAI